MSHRRDLPGKDLPSNFPCSWGNCATQAQLKTLWHRLADWKEEEAPLSGCGSEEGCRWTLPRDCAVIWDEHQLSVRGAWKCCVWAGFQAVLGPGMYSMNVRYSVLSSLIMWREEGGRYKEECRRQVFPLRKNRSTARLIGSRAIHVSLRDTV